MEDFLITHPISFRVIEGGRQPLHRVPMVPRDDLSAARGIAVGVLLAVPVWCCIAGIVWWAWASGAVRP